MSIRLERVRTTRSTGDRMSRICRGPVLIALLGGMVTAAPGATQTVQTTADTLLAVQRGSSAIITVPDTLLRVSVADPAVLEAVVIPPRQLVLNAMTVGSTSLILWGRNETSQLYTVEVTADLASLERQLRELFPGVDLSASSTGTG